MARSIMERLKFSNDQIASVSKCVAIHMDLRDADVSDSALRRFVRKAGDVLEDVLGLMHADALSHSGEYNRPEKIPTIRARLAKMKMEEKKVQKVVSGEDVMAAFGIPAGPKVGALLREVQNNLDSNPSMSKEELLEALKRKG